MARPKIGGRGAGLATVGPVGRDYVNANVMKDVTAEFRRPSAVEASITPLGAPLVE